MGDLRQQFKDSSKVLAYVRVSTEEQKDKGSADRQESTVREKLKNLGVPESKIKVYRDEGVSGTWPREERPQFNQMLKDAKSIRKPVITARETSRLYRSSWNMGKDMAEIIVPENIHLSTLEEGLVTGTKSKPMPADDMLFQILVTMAQLEAEQRRQQTGAGMQALYDAGFEKGHWFNLYPDANISVYREVAKRYDDVVSYIETKVGMSQSSLGKLISRKAGFKKDGITPLIGISWAGKNMKFAEAPMARIRKAISLGILDEWLDLIDRLVKLEREHGAKNKRIEAIRYQTNGALKFNPNAPPPSYYTDEILQHMFDNFKQFQSAKQKKGRK